MLPPHEPEGAVGLLVAITSLQRFQECRHELTFRDYVLDSGAFLAMTAGKPITIPQFLAAAKMVRADPKCTEIFALDVIGDPKGSMANYAAIRAAGVDAIPTYHYGEPLEMLDELARTYDKIALGGVARRLRAHARVHWAEACLNRVWPKKVHGFGYSAGSLKHLPFHSIDASTWLYNTRGFGNYQSFGSTQLSIRGNGRDFRAEVEHNLKMEREARGRWRLAMRALGCEGQAPTVRLALGSCDAEERAALMTDRSRAMAVLAADQARKAERRRAR